MAKRKPRALRGWHWFLGRCLVQERKKTPLARLATRALNHSLLREAETSGHILQACGGVQRFLAKHPDHKRAIRRAPASRPFDPRGAMLKDWCTFVASVPGQFGRRAFGYNMATLRGYLTPRRGGTRRRGGGGDYEFKIVLRLMATFM